jgi:hypothetical protein
MFLTPVLVTELLFADSQAFQHERSPQVLSSERAADDQASMWRPLSGVGAPSGVGGQFPGAGGRRAAEWAGLGGAGPYLWLLVTTPIWRSLWRVDALEADGDVPTVVSVKPAAVAIMGHISADQHGAGGQDGEDHAMVGLNAMATRAMYRQWSWVNGSSSSQCNCGIGITSWWWVAWASQSSCARASVGLLKWAAFDVFVDNENISGTSDWTRSLGQD